ncbi:OX-2 membrane glycoprotein-like isoform X2 [Erinaceus europaeus]|uniref:OX-2 membrane glycoprotein-like isoform X2 n=1 Tax=Erinaceus europaeus TaxID=9365 RepID=A0ABM3XZZ4_ERIEU|nr:OX-2 membrane glycoprotein-like isoform X2 [Erinaceus europaeus]
MRTLPSNFVQFSFHPILQFLMLPLWVQESDSLQKIKHKNNETAVLGGNVTMFCNLTTPANVVQITWQKVQNSLPRNIGTYSSIYGENILPPYKNRLRCKAIEPNFSFITIHEVTFEDEACYKCLFNVFPHGNQGGQICLYILTVSELRGELQPNLDSSDFVRLIYSAEGKPAPQISLFPTQVLSNPPEEYLAENPNGTVTITKTYNISLETVRSLSLQHVVVHMDHPLRNEVKYIPVSAQEVKIARNLELLKTRISIIHASEKKILTIGREFTS